MTVTGTTPPGTHTEQEAANWVRGMFAQVAPRYDLLNHLLSFNIDRSWRKALIHQLEPALRRQSARVLDLCCGTGDVLLDLQALSATPVIGADFCRPMLTAAQEKIARASVPSVLVEADAMRLPFADESVDGVSIAFGFRNLASYDDGLRELQRVLKPRGLLAILEFSHPSGVLTKAAYRFYSTVLLPVIGKVVSGSADAYTYLPDSIRKFPGPQALQLMMKTAGFENCSYELLTGGIAALHIGTKA